MDNNIVRQIQDNFDLDTGQPSARIDRMEANWIKQSIQLSNSSLMCHHYCGSSICWREWIFLLSKKLRCVLRLDIFNVEQMGPNAIKVEL